MSRGLGDVYKRQMPNSLTAFGINGGLKGGLAGLLMTHPPLEVRIEALRQRG